MHLAGSLLLSLLPLFTLGSDHQYEHEYIEDGIIEDLTFGDHGAIWAKDHRHITGWTISGKDYTPELHSDRIILTPPWPGHRRGAIWAQHATSDAEWEAEFEFRASGPENGSGNLAFWYAMNPTVDIGYNSPHTVGKFNGISLLFSQSGEWGGRVQGFLNDGSVSFKDHHDLTQMAWGTCDFNYRNLGRFSKVKVSQTFWTFSVEIDGVECLRTTNIHLPHNYYFGLTAASSENPDSFEAHSFIVHKLKEGKRIANARGHGAHPEDHSFKDENEQWKHDVKEFLKHEEVQKVLRNEAATSHKGNGEFDHHDTPGHVPGYADYGHTEQHHQDDRGGAWTWTPEDEILHDEPASHYTSESARFQDLHDRITSVYHQLDLLYHDMTTLKGEVERQHDDVMYLLRTVAAGVDVNKHTMEKVEHDVEGVKKDLEDKDYRELLTQLHYAFHEGHLNLSDALHKNNPRMNFFAFLIVASNVMLLASYMIYRRRKERQPKKYL